MKKGDIVFVKILGLDCMFMGHVINPKTNKSYCLVYADNDKQYIVDESDIEFLETLEESLTHVFDGANNA